MAKIGKKGPEELLLVTSSTLVVVVVLLILVRAVSAVVACGSCRSWVRREPAVGTARAGAGAVTRAPIASRRLTRLARVAIGAFLHDVRFEGSYRQCSRLVFQSRTVVSVMVFLAYRSNWPHIYQRYYDGRDENTRQEADTTVRHKELHSHLSLHSCLD